MIFEISGWQFDAIEPILRGPLGERRLEDRAARVLKVLCTRRGEVVSRDELIEQVWGGRTVSANSVSIVIGALRRALGDDPDHPGIITTIARRGYRLVDETAPAPALPPGAPAVPGKGMQARRWWTAVPLAVAAAASVLLVRSERPLPVSVEAALNVTRLPSYDVLTASLTPVVEHGVGRLGGVRLVEGGAREAEAPRVVVSSKLILWNGAPELALRAIDLKTHTIIWSAFAAGPPPLLARHVEQRLAALDGRLPR